MNSYSAKSTLLMNDNYISSVRSASVDKIIDAISGYFEISKKEILSKRRTKNLVEARHILVYFLRELKKLSFPEIGRIVGGRDHTTSIYAHGKVKEELKTSETIQAIITELSDIISDLKTGEKKPIKITRPTTHQEIVRPPNYTYRNITKREKDMVEDWRKNIVLEKIAQKHKITRERVRQIVFRAIRQEAINRSLEEGFAIDLDEVLKSEKELRSQYGKREEEKPEKKEKRWSRFYTHCVQCRTTHYPHLRKGLCALCGGGVYGKHRERIIDEVGGVCTKCGIDRKTAKIIYGRDFYITKQKEVLCRRCFQKITGKALSKSTGWSRKYNRCIKCQSTQNPHFSKGYCRKCTPEITPEKREELIEKIGGVCKKCGITRTEAKRKLKRDLYLIKNGWTLCRKCFHKYRFNQKYLP